MNEYVADKPCVLTCVLLSAYTQRSYEIFSIVPSYLGMEILAKKKYFGPHGTHRNFFRCSFLFFLDRELDPLELFGSNLDGNFSTPTDFKNLRMQWKDYLS